MRNNFSVHGDDYTAGHKVIGWVVNDGWHQALADLEDFGKYWTMSSITLSSSHIVRCLIPSMAIRLKPLLTGR